MGTPAFYNYRTILEEKVVAYLQSKIPNVAIHKGITDDVRVIPIIICHAESASSVDSLGSHTLGNYRINLKVYIYSSADDESLDVHRGRVMNVMGALDNDQELKDSFNPQTDGKLYDIWFTSDDEGMSQRRYGNVLEYTVFGALPPAP